MPPVSGRIENRSWRTRLTTGPGTVGLFIAAMLMLGACTDPTDQRAVQPGEVATDIIPVQVASSSPATQASPVSTSSPTPTTSTAVSSAGVQPAAKRIYFTQGGDLWQIPVDMGDPAPVLTGHSILAFAPSPDGEQVAIVYLSGNADQEHLANFKADGTSIIDIALSIPADDQSSRGGDIQSISWSPSGDRVAVARQDGSISVVTANGTVRQILNPNTQRFPGSLSVSPDGRTLLYLDPSLPGRATSLYTIPLGGGAARKLVDGNRPNHPVLAAKWLPTGNQIVYIQAVASSPPGTGDLFIVDSDTVIRELMVPSAQFAPVAGIGDMALSGDGRWVAFNLYVPGDSGSRFQGLWLMNLATRATQQVVIESGQAVTDLWWGQETLAYRTVRSTESSDPERYTGIEPFSLYTVKPDGSQPVVRHRAP